MKKEKRISRERLNRGIFLLPNIFTTLNMFCGFYALIASIEAEYASAAIAIMIAGLFDYLDDKSFLFLLKRLIPLTRTSRNQIGMIGQR